MAKGLYRVYLYVVTIALLIFATVSVSALLNTLLRLTPLRGSNSYTSAPTGAEITQNVTLALVTLVIVAGLGGLHYWLIRRDMAGDPQPGASGVRSLMLNLAVGVATLVAVTTGASALSQFDLTFNNDLSMSLAVALTTAALVIALEWERRRAVATKGAALVFQRLRISGVALILALTLVGFMSNAVYQTEQGIGQASGAYTCWVTEPTGPTSGGEFYGPCVGSQVIGYWAAVALVVLAWLIYLRMSASDLRTLIRPIFMLLGFAAGVIALVYGLQRAAEYVLRLITSTDATRPDYLHGFDFAPSLTYAAVVLGVYGWNLRRGAQFEPLDAPTTHLTMRAIAAAIFAFPFWLGAQMLLNNLFIKLFPGSVITDTYWHTALAFAIAGLAYVPLALWLGRSSSVEGIKGPRRGFVLALLAAGALVTAGGLATLIYSVVTALLNVPLPDWESVARYAGAALIVGLILGGLYFWLALREGQFTRAPRPETPEAPEAPVAGAIDAALDDVLAAFQQGRLTQAEAAERIRTLSREGVLV